MRERSRLAQAKASSFAELDREICLLSVVGEVVQSLISGLDSGVALHAGAVSLGGKGILLPGPTGTGKSSLTAWLAKKGFGYLTDECVVLHHEVPAFSALARPLVLKSGAIASVLGEAGDQRTVLSGSNAIVWPENIAPTHEPYSGALIVFPLFEQGTEPCLEPLSAAETALELMACNVNARNLRDHGFGTVTGLAEKVPAFVLRYGSFDQLDGAFDPLLKLLAGGALDPHTTRRAFGLFKRTDEETHEQEAREFPPPNKSQGVPAATPRGKARKLTIGMAAYDDYDGVYFTLQALRMYHPEIVEDTEFVVIDNNPEGACAADMKALEYWVPNFRYVPFQDRTGTAVRDLVFEEASGELVLCIDCHVFIVRGAVKQLLDHFDRNPRTKDLLQGPLIYDDLNTFSTHFETTWSEGMFGQWLSDDRGKDADAAPFDIPMQGLGLFACRRDAWPGFNPRFRGFGGEEGYIHEKIRRAGGRTLCLPFLRWMHRFNRPLGALYTNTWDDRIRNYMIGFRELGWDLEPLKDHFVAFLGPEIARPIFKSVEAELSETPEFRPFAASPES